MKNGLNDPLKSSSLGPKPELLQDFTNLAHKAMRSTKYQNTGQGKQERSSMQVQVKNPYPQGIKIESKAQTTPKAQGRAKSLNFPSRVQVWS